MKPEKQQPLSLWITYIIVFTLLILSMGMLAGYVIREVSFFSAGSRFLVALCVVMALIFAVVVFAGLFGLLSELGHVDAIENQKKRNKKEGDLAMYALLGTLALAVIIFFGGIHLDHHVPIILDSVFGLFS